MSESAHGWFISRLGSAVAEPYRQGNARVSQSGRTLSAQETCY